MAACSVYYNKKKTKLKIVQDCASSTDNFKAGEHVVVFWREDDGGFKWYLGVVTENTDSGSKDVLVSYYKRGNKAGTS